MLSVVETIVRFETNHSTYIVPGDTFELVSHLAVYWCSLLSLHDRLRRTRLFGSVSRGCGGSRSLNRRGAAIYIKDLDMPYVIVEP